MAHDSDRTLMNVAPLVGRLRTAGGELCIEAADAIERLQRMFCQTERDLVEMRAIALEQTGDNAAEKSRHTTLPPMTALPSVHDLVRRIRVLCDAADACPDEREGAREWMDAQDTALRNLVATMPAVTLADAAAQLYVAAGVVEYMEDFNLPRASIAKAVSRLRRMLRSVLPIVAEAAGLELVALAGEHQADRCADEFPRLAPQSACSVTGRATP